jgi:hypothetical protein
MTYNTSNSQAYFFPIVFDFGFSFDNEGKEPPLKENNDPVLDRQISWVWQVTQNSYSYSDESIKCLDTLVNNYPDHRSNLDEVQKLYVEIKEAFNPNPSQSISEKAKIIYEKAKEILQSLTTLTHRRFYVISPCAYLPRGIQTPRQSGFIITTSVTSSPRSSVSEIELDHLNTSNDSDHNEPT